MPKITEDFSKISSSMEPLPEGEYRLRLEEIEEPEVEAGRNPPLIFKSVVTEGEHTDRQCWDYVYLAKNDGEKNKIGLGRVKAYAEAILGKEAANATDGFDTDDLLKGEFTGVMKARTYEDKTTKEQKSTVELKKVLPVG